jgi:hypothetical protein
MGAPGFPEAAAGDETAIAGRAAPTSQGVVARQAHSPNATGRQQNDIEARTKE